jgi:hypothetical protein
MCSCSTHLPAPEDKCATLDGVDDNVATGQEGVVAPGANKVSDTSAGSAVVLGIDVEVANLTDRATSGVLGKRANVENTKASTIVALVGETVVDELIVVNTDNTGLEVAGLAGSAKVADVPEISGRTTVRGGARPSVLVILIVKDQELLPCCVGDPALVGV